MKKYLKIVSSFLLIGFVLTLSHCDKKKDTATTTCKTCKAFGAGVDQQTIQKQVCTPEEEATFRTQNAGKEIVCQ